MSLPLIYTQPQSDSEWRAWAFNHAANHKDIIQALQISKNATNLQEFILDPMDFNNLGNWDFQHQIMHQQANAILGTQGYDLLSLDWEDPDQLSTWLRLNGDEHARLSAALGIG